MARRAIERGRMRHEDELTIQKHILEIEQVIEGKDLTGPLFARHVIDFEDMEFIQAGETRPERARRLLNIIVLRGPKSFEALVESLKVMGYNELSDKLKGTRSSTQGITSHLRDEEVSSSLSDEVSRLRSRLTQVEQSRAMNEDLGVLRRDVTDDLKNVASKLQKIEELSRVSRETVTTINALTKQLDEKDKLLDAAKKQIEKLERKVSTLEQENAKLRISVEKQQRQIASLKQAQNEDRRRTRSKLVQLEEERRQDKKEMEERILRMETDKEKMMNVVHTLVHELAEVKNDSQNKQSPGGLRVKPKPIVPRNRFQKATGK